MNEKEAKLVSKLLAGVKSHCDAWNDEYENDCYGCSFLGEFGVCVFDEEIGDQFPRFWDLGEEVADNG